MGFLRLYLAICVVATHSSAIFPWVIHTGREAVQIFYLISGFYMAHIATKYSSALEFYASRFIRIYVPYYFVLLFVVISSLLSGLIFNYWAELAPLLTQTSKNGTLGVVISTLSNLTVFFQDSMLFLSDDLGQGLSFTTNFRDSKAPLYQYLMVPQAWTIGIELTFYLFVPILAKRNTKTLIIICCLSLAARAFSYEYLNLRYDPWNYRFFPFELAIFILGMISHRLYARLNQGDINVPVSAIRTATGYIVSIGIVLLLAYLTKTGSMLASPYIGSRYAELASYGIWALLIPILFLVFGKIRIDRHIGELSYPVYLIHLIVIFYLSEIVKRHKFELNNLGILSAAISVAFAILIYLYVIRPVDKRRYALAKSVATNVAELKH